MARYTTSIRTDRTVDDVFAYMSDLRNFAEWDPGTKRVVQIDGDEPGLDTRYDVTVSNPGRDITLSYQVVTWNAPNDLVARAESKMLISEDQISVRSESGSTLVTYTADLRLKGVFRVADFALGMAFKRIGHKAAVSLSTHLDGEIITG